MISNCFRSSVLQVCALTLIYLQIWYLLDAFFELNNRFIDPTFFFIVETKLLLGFFALAPLVSTAIISRYDPPLQVIPATVKPDNTFNAGTYHLVREPEISTEIPPAVYGARPIDLPFGRLYHGNMKYFSKGQLNTPDGITDVYTPGVNDFANQSACGIFDNAFHISKVAIHPYFLKYADLSRM